MQVNVGTSFTRPNNTTAYLSGQLVANSATAADVNPLSFNPSKTNGMAVKVTRARIFKSGTSTTNASFRLHLYQAAASSTLVPANGDGGAFSTSGYLAYLGAFDVTVGEAFTDGASGEGVPNVGSYIGVNLGAGQLWGFLEARAGYTPVALEAFGVTLELDQSI